MVHVVIRMGRFIARGLAMLVNMLIWEILVIYGLVSGGMSTVIKIIGLFIGSGKEYSSSSTYNS